MMIPLSEERNQLKIDPNIVNLSYIPNKVKPAERYKTKDFLKMNAKVNEINDKINNNKEQS